MQSRRIHVCPHVTNRCSGFTVGAVFCAVSIAQTPPIAKTPPIVANAADRENATDRENAADRGWRPSGDEESSGNQARRYDSYDRG